MPTVGYFPFAQTDRSVEAGWLSEHLDVDVRVAGDAPSLNELRTPLLPLDRLREAVAGFVALPAIVLEGPGGFLWAALLRAHGFAGTVTVLPYVNPRGWRDVSAAALYRRFSRPGDRVFLGSTPAAAIYRSHGIEASVGEPYGIDDRLFRPRAGATRTCAALGIAPGRMLVYAGRAQPDKDLYRLLRVGLKARLLFGDLQVVVASHVVDDAYLAAARKELAGHDYVHLVDPTREQLADLYSLADVFVTASTSHFETFGRAPAEALACGAPAVAPRYDGFVETLAQPGGTLVDVELDPESVTPRVDEEQLLRAVYDVLSSPQSASRAEVAAVARRRFGRSTTIGLLAYLANGNGTRPRPTAPPELTKLPSEWRQPLAELERREKRDALSWFCDGCEHERFATHDTQHAAQVRRSLCVPELAGEEA